MKSRIICKLSIPNCLYKKIRHKLRGTQFWEVVCEPSSICSEFYGVQDSYFRGALPLIPQPFQMNKSLNPAGHSSLINHNEVAASINFSEVRKDFTAIKDRTVPSVVRSTYLSTID
jgi:hypothetical protein